MNWLLILTILSSAGFAMAVQAAEQRHYAERKGARELGIVIGNLEPGKYNAITDVPGVMVGHCTVVQGDNIRTGVTAILPHEGNIFMDKVEGAVEVYNGFGKLAGSTQVNELGNIETPIVLTNTLSVPRAADALLSYMLSLPGMEKVYSINPFVAETNDGYLNEIQQRTIGEKEVVQAIKSASSGVVAQGAIGAGTATRALGFKGGIGTSSRIVEIAGRSYIVGVLVQSNFDGSLIVDGVPVGRIMGNDTGVDQDGSCVIVVGTDAPLDHRQLKRLARRSFAGMARVGAGFSNGSGDYAIAFSNAVRHTYGGPEIYPAGERIGNDAISALFGGVMEASEEALLNSVLKTETVSGREGRVSKAVNTEKLIRIMSENSENCK